MCTKYNFIYMKKKHAKLSHILLKDASICDETKEKQGADSQFRKVDSSEEQGGASSGMIF